MLGLLIGAAFAAGEALTVAWLSAFPERVSDLPAMRIKFWSLAIAAISLVLVALGLLIHWKRGGRR